MEDKSFAWRTCTSFLSKADPSVSIEQYNASLQVLQQAGLTRVLGVWAVYTFEKAVADQIGQPLSVISQHEEPSPKVLEVVADAHSRFKRMRRTVATLETLPGCGMCTKKFVLRAFAVMDVMVTENFPYVIYNVMKAQLQGFDRMHDSVDTLRMLCAQLVDLGFFRVVDRSVSWVVYERTDQLVLERVKGNVRSRALPSLVHWLNQFVDDWIMSVLPPPASEDVGKPGSSKDIKMSFDGDVRASQIQRWRKRLSFHLHEAVCGIRTRQLLQIIDSFPESLPALEDLKDCLKATDEKPVVTASLREQFKEKMLNVGTLTSDILQQYVNMIRTLRFLDPTGVILENVSEPVREYLHRRPDTVRCIVSEMTGDGDLYDELERGRPRRGNDKDGDVAMGGGSSSIVTKIRDQEDEDCQSIDGDYDADGRIDEEAYNNWQPDPIDAPLRDGKWHSGGDAIATLVAIYGSSEQIVNEYKGMLADKLISTFDLDLERETRILQLLTERFGKDAMHDCLIMLKDVSDSQAALDHASSEKKDPSRVLEGFETTVISKEFWPTLVEEPAFKPRPKLEHQMSLYGDTFKELKDPRKLRWQHGLGVVSVTLQFEDGREVEAVVTPMQATILSHFAEKKRHNIKRLQRDMEVEDESLFRRRVQGLATQGLIRAADASNSVYETVEEAVDLDGAMGIDEEASDEDDEHAVNSSKEDAEMAVYEKFIMAMLQNLKELPLEKIHSTLQVFVQTPAYDKTPDQLAAFLGHLIEEDKIELTAGTYRIKK